MGDLAQDRSGGSIPRSKASKNLHLDFSQLKMLTGDDDEFMIEIIGMIVEESPGALQDMYHLAEQKQYPLLGGRAHKYKSTISILGNQELLELMKNIETETNEACRHEQLIQYVQEFDSICNGLMDQLNVELARLKG